ncbi:MAG TPA: PEP-CTERM sorting domain-containing protein, partial [Tepidisphaeraceae bacterium]|nr:PEP-CTERM sorting domain-containing protein [Tepidisphaeraceae bacterium]
SGSFFIRAFNGTSYDTVTPANNNQADFQNLGAAGRPDLAGSYVNFAGGWAGASTPDQNSQTYTDGQAVGWSSTVPTTSPQSGSTMGGSFNVVGTTTSGNTGVADVSFQTLARAVVPHAQLTAFDVTLVGDQGNVTSKLVLGLLGDTDFSYSVNGADLSHLLSRYNTTSGNTWALGDFNGDGAVNGADLSMMLSNYNKTVAPTPAPAAAMALVMDASAVSVPEPASIGLLGAAAGALMLRRRRTA